MNVLFDLDLEDIQHQCAISNRTSNVANVINFLNQELIHTVKPLETRTWFVFEHCSLNLPSGSAVNCDVIGDVDDWLRDVIAEATETFD